MAESQEGLAAVYNIDGTLAYTGVAKTANILTGYGFTETGRENNLVRQGHIIGAAKDERVRRISWTIEIYDPTTPASTEAAAKTATVLPPIFGDLVIDDFDVAFADGTWTIRGDVTWTPQDGGYATLSGTAEQYYQADTTWKALSQI